MYRLVSQLLLYGDIADDSPLVRLSDIVRRWEAGCADPGALRRETLHEVKRLLDISTKYGFDEDLWQSYLTYVMLTSENSFSLTCERAGVSDGTVNSFALHDFHVFRELFSYDFSGLENGLGLSCLTAIRHYRAIPKRESVYNRSVSSLVARVRRAFAAATTDEAAFEVITGFYRNHGVGAFGFDRAFRISGSGRELRFGPINNLDSVRLDDIVGYEQQKGELRANTEAFIAGRSCNNVLLYGDSGTGKSTSVKALINDYADSGLRMIEIYKYQFRELGEVIARIKKRNYRFIIFIDDLSFEENETEYKFLKAVIEGGVETRPDNILIYATSNRRHLIRETWNDRSNMEHLGDVHRSDTVEEKLSLASRFGVAINYSSPGRKHYHEIVLALAERQGLLSSIGKEELLKGADAWDIRHGGVSGRAAQQYIDYLSGRRPENKQEKES